jgi:hypothetical protein
VLLRMRGHVTWPTTQRVLLKAEADDGFHLSIGGRVVVGDEDWARKGFCSVSSSSVTFVAGVSQPLDAWYFQAERDAAVSLLFSADEGETWEVVPKDRFQRYRPATASGSASVAAAADSSAAAASVAFSPGREREKGVMLRYNASSVAPHFSPTIGANETMRQLVGQTSNFVHRVLTTSIPVSYFPTSLYPNGFQLNRHNMLDVVSLPSQYVIIFDILPIGLSSGCDSVLHLTATGGNAGFGARLPGPGPGPG